MKRIYGPLISAGLAGLLVAFYLVSHAPTMLRAVSAAPISGTATVSGNVDAPRPFKAAQVYFRATADRAEP